MNSIIRRIDDLGRVVIPKEVRRVLEIKEGDPLEVQYNRNGEIIIRKYRKPFEQRCHEWYDDHINLMYQCEFLVRGDHTFCIVPSAMSYSGKSRGGHAKRCHSDHNDKVIGYVAAYANAMGLNLNKMIGYEE